MRFLHLIVVFLPLQAMASFTGTFTGQGKATMHPSGKVRNCTHIYFQIEQTEKQLHVLAAGYECQDLQAEFPEFKMKIEGGKLFSGTVQTGTITESELTLFTFDAEEEFTYDMQLIKRDNKIQFLERWTEGLKPALTVEGSLRRQN